MRKVFTSKFQITQDYNARPEYYSQFGLKGHEGIDLIPTGSDWNILAVEDGIVVKDEDNAKSGAYGIYLTIWHPQLKKATQYCHLSKNTVSINDGVKKRQVIGTMGESGNTQGAHLHLNLFEVDDNGMRLNKNNGYFGGINPYAFLMEDDLQAELDKCRNARDEHWNDLQKTKLQITDLEGQVNEYKGKLESEQKHTLELNDQIADLAIIIQKIKDESKNYGQQIIDAEHDRDNYKSIVNSASDALGSSTTLVSILNAIDELKKPQDVILKDREKLLTLIFNDLTYKRVPKWMKSIKEKIIMWFE